MIAIFYTLENETRGKVGRIHYKPNKLTSEQLEGSVIVEAIPEAEQHYRKHGILYVNPQTLDLWYEYIDRPLTQEELMQDFVIEMKKMQYITMQQFPQWRPSHNYYITELCIYNGILYEVIQAHISQTNWEPPNVPALFKIKNSENITAQWVQPQGAHDSYHLGDKVIFQNHVWISLMANNVWAPNIEGWEIVW